MIAEIDNMTPRETPLPNEVQWWADRCDKILESSSARHAENTVKLDSLARNVDSMRISLAVVVGDDLGRGGSIQIMQRELEKLKESQDKMQHWLLGLLGWAVVELALTIIYLIKTGSPHTP